MFLAFLFIIWENLEKRNLARILFFRKERNNFETKNMSQGSEQFFQSGFWLKSVFVGKNSFSYFKEKLFPQANAGQQFLLQLFRNINSRLFAKTVDPTEDAKTLAPNNWVTIGCYFMQLMQKKLAMTSNFFNMLDCSQFYKGNFLATIE